MVCSDELASEMRCFKYRSCGGVIVRLPLIAVALRYVDLIQTRKVVIHVVALRKARAPHDPGSKRSSGQGVSPSGVGEVQDVIRSFLRLGRSDEDRPLVGAQNLEPMVDISGVLQL